jgi:hypothetical protein
MPPRKPVAPVAAVIHRVFGECSPIQRIVTANGLPALRVRCPDGTERTIALLKEHWLTPLPALFAVPTDPPKRTRAKGENVRATGQEADELSALETRLEDAEADREALQEEKDEEVMEEVA